MNRLGQIAGVARRHVDAGSLSGVEWAVLRGGEPWMQGRYGMADATRGQALPDNPIYRIFSMTKPVISAAAMMLVEQGRLRLFDPLVAFLPEFADMQVLQPDGGLQPASLITIEHLLTHRAGFSYGFLPDCPVGALYQQADLRDTGLSLAELVRRIAGLPLAFQPGTEWRYSMATDVLARVLEVVCGQPLPEVLHEMVLSPLGTKDTGYWVAPEQESRIMPMFGKTNLDEVMDYSIEPQTLELADMRRDQPHDNPAYYRGGTGLFSTLPDYLLIARFLQTGLAADGARLLSAKSVQMMWTDRIPAAQKPLMIGPFVLAGYGWGLAGRVMADPAQALVLTEAGECGWAGAGSTFFWIDARNDLVGVVMTQFLGSKIPIGEDFLTAVYQALPE